MDQPGKVGNRARGQLKKENEYYPVPVRAREFSLARRVQPSCLSRVSLLILHTQAGHQPGMVANRAARGQLNREKYFFSMSLFAHEILVSQTGPAFPSRVSPLILHPYPG